MQGVARVGLKGWVGLWGILGSVVALGMKVARGPTTGAHIIPATRAKPINTLGLARVFVARAQLLLPATGNIAVRWSAGRATNGANELYGRGRAAGKCEDD